MSYFSARIAVVCLVPGPVPEEGYAVDIQVHVFTAKDFDEAREIAIDIGQSEEHSYNNQFEERVSWKFLRIENITHLGAVLDRTEVSTRMEGWTPSSPMDEEITLEQVCSNIEYFDESVT